MAGIAEAVAEIKTAFKESEDKLRELLKTQQDEIKNLGGTQKETSDKIKKAEEQLARIGADLVEAQKKLKEQTDRLDELEKKMSRPDFGGGAERRKSYGELFAESDAYKEFINQGYTGKSRTVEVKSFFRKSAPAETLDGTSLGNVPGYLYSPERLAEIISQPDRMQRVRDLLPVLTTTQGAIEFVRETGFTNNAAGVAEGALKPTSQINFEIASTSVKTIAHWLPVTRQILADASQIRGYIDTRLIVGLKLEEDEQILYGDGTSANLQGILTDPAVQSFDPAVDAKSGDTKIDMIRRAMTKARVAEYPVSGVVLNPADWEEIELLKDGDGRYIWVNVVDGGEQRLWRVPVIDTTAINQGDFLTGAFSLGAALWDREEAGIRASESHEDFFVRNLLAILAEERLALTIYRPEAFVYGQFSADSA